MRITFVLPYAGLAGGIRVLAIYAERLHSLGHDVNVISLPPRTVGIREKVKSFLLWNGWPRQQVSGPSHFSASPVSHRVLEAARPVVDSDVPDADVVLATFWKTASWVAALSPEKGRKAILLQGYETSPGQESPEIDAAWRTPLHKIVISNWLVDLARDRFGDRFVSHVPNSVDTQMFWAPERGKQVVPTIGMLYATLHLKGIDVVLAALELVKAAIGPVNVVAFGAEHMSSDLPLPNGAQFLYQPEQNQIRDLYSRCDVWVCGSRREGFHLPPLEAMACRCPVVSTRVGGPLDTITNGVNGYLVDVDDVAALAGRIVDVLRMDEPRWKLMSAEALSTATRYSWDDATKILENVLFQLTDADGKSPVGTGGSPIL